VPRYVAFLRAVNVGGRVVRMDVLREIFASLGFDRVETFIASGNVVFESPDTEASALERRIMERLEETLVAAIATFVRSDVELAEVAASRPFSAHQLETAAALNVAFTHEPVDEAAQRRLLALTTDIDDFSVIGREVYWLCRKRQSQSTFSNAALEKVLGRQSTLRGWNTVTKMAAKWPPEERER
jgi:uncharacterized protein (DUF1697 family)